MEDVAAKIDVNPDDVEVIKPKRRRTSTLLKKAEKKALVEKLKAVTSDCHEAVISITRIIDAENHIHVFKQHEILWNKLQQQQSLLAAIFNGLVETFIHSFKCCEKGKDKYCRFQVEWHNQCSVLLKDQVDDASIKDLAQIHQRWLGFCEGSCVTIEAFNPVMISLCAAVYEFLMHQVFEEQRVEKDASQLPMLHIKQDTDDVYFRFGGAALASMLHLRYDSLKSAPISKKDSINP